MHTLCILNEATVKSQTTYEDLHILKSVVSLGLFIMFLPSHKLMKIEVLRPVSWRNTTKHVTCNSVDEQRDTEN